jgi:D-amino-acid dehydrogenase
MSYARVGALSVSTNAADLDALAAAISARAAEAPEVGEVRRLRPAAARALFPPLHPDMAAVLATGGARVDGRRLAAALCDGAQRAGATVVSAPATLVARGGRIAGVRAGDRDIAADAVVVAAGAWAPALLAPLGVRLDVAPQRGQITHLRLPGVDTARWPVVSPPTSHYLVAFDDSRVVVGATRESGSGFDHRVTAAGQAEVLNAALAVAPGLAAATVIETRIGFRPLKPDNRPVLAAVPGLPGLLVGNGLGANGLTIGPFAGRLLADLALGRRPELDLAPYALPA